MAQAVLEQFLPHVHDLNDACFKFAVIVDGRQWTVEVPLSHVQIAFQKHGRALGCSLPRSVGSVRHRTVGGFFDSIKRAYKSVTRKVKKALPKVAQRAIHHVEKAAETAAHYTMRAHQLAKNIVKSDAFAAGLVGASFLVPALAPAAGAVIAARTMINRIDAGKKAAAAIARGVQKTPALLSAIAQGKKARAGAATMVSAAKTGNQTAQQFMGALRQIGR